MAHEGLHEDVELRCGSAAAEGTLLVLCNGAGDDVSQVVVPDAVLTDELVAAVQVSALFGAWLVRAEGWLDIWTGAIRQPVTRVGTPLVRAALPDGDGGLAGIGTGGPVPVVIRGQRWATPEEVAAGFAAASGEVDIPLAYTILRRSLVELHAGDYRLCVIDACSAEVALDAALTAYLQAHGLTGADTERLLRLGSGIAEAFPVYQQLVAAGRSAVSRNRVIDQLANPRNQAVHAGEHPDEHVAERARETSARLMGEAVPLPRPDDIPRLARAIARRRAPRPAVPGGPTSRSSAAPARAAEMRTLYAVTPMLAVWGGPRRSSAYK